MNIWYLPIQPLEERYSAQWWTMFPDEFNRRSIQFGVIQGERLTATINNGTFLDTNDSLYWQASQLKQVARLFHYKQIKDGDVFFVADIEFWGIEAIRYLATLNDVKIKLCGFCHAGSYTKEDFFAKCAPYAKSYEHAWGRIFDKIFVGSHYHKRQLKDLRGIPGGKIAVTGNPYDIEGTLSQLPKVKKKNRIICTNRPDPEKRPGMTLATFITLHRVHPDWEFMVTTSRKQWGTGELRDHALHLQTIGIITIKENLSKLEYLTLLAESKVMTGNSIEENFGYCILEALITNTIPIVEKNYSHPELLNNDDRCLFMNPIHQRTLIEIAMKSPFKVSQYAEPYKKSLSKIVDLLVER